MLPTVSVAVATRKRADRLDRLLHALAACSAPTAMRQTTTIVVDNDTDRAAEIVVNRHRTASRLDLVYIHEPTAGVSHARNAAVLACDTDYLAFIDDDMTPSTDWLRALTSGVLNHRSGAAIGPVPVLFEAEPPPGLKESGVLEFDNWEDGASVDTIRTGNVIINTAVLGKAPFEPRLDHIGGEDHLLGRSLHARGVRIVFVDAAIASEWTPADRLEPAALRRRQERLGTAYTTVDFILRSSASGQIGRRVQHLLSALARVTSGAVLSLPPVAAIRPWRGHQLLWFGIGQLKAVTGRSFDYYGNDPSPS